MYYMMHYNNSPTCKIAGRGPPSGSLWKIRAKWRFIAANIMLYARPQRQLQWAGVKKYVYHIYTYVYIVYIIGTCMGLSENGMQ